MVWEGCGDFDSAGLLIRPRVLSELLTLLYPQLRFTISISENKGIRQRLPYVEHING